MKKYSGKVWLSDKIVVLFDFYHHMRIISFSPFSQGLTVHNHLLTRVEGTAVKVVAKKTKSTQSYEKSEIQKRLTWWISYFKPFYWNFSNLFFFFRLSHLPLFHFITYILYNAGIGDRLTNYATYVHSTLWRQSINKYMYEVARFVGTRFCIFVCFANNMY